MIDEEQVAFWAVPLSVCISGLAEIDAAQTDTRVDNIEGNAF